MGSDGFNLFGLIFSQHFPMHTSPNTFMLVFTLAVLIILMERKITISEVCDDASDDKNDDDNSDDNNDDKSDSNNDVVG